MFEMLAHEHELDSETLSSFVDSSVDNILFVTRIWTLSFRHRRCGRLFLAIAGFLV